MEHSEELIKGIRRGLLQWYDFKPESDILFIGTQENSLAEMLIQCGHRVICLSENLLQDGSLLQYNGMLDYVIAIEALEKIPFPVRALRRIKELLKQDGTLLLGMNNRLGIRYFCGDRDCYTGRNFDGIEGYGQAKTTEQDNFLGRMYSQAEIKKMIGEAGWEMCRFFSVISDLKNPSLIYAEDYLPNEDLANRVFPAYYYPKSVFLEEERLYADLIENGMFHQTANAYLIECPNNGLCCDVSHVTCQAERGRERALFTVIRKSGIVEKRAVCKEGEERLKRLAEHGRDLAEHGIRVVEAKMQHGVYVMPYIHAQVGQLYLKHLILTDKQKFLQEMDHFRDLILSSSEIVKPDTGDGEGVLLQKGYIDMVPLNTFYIDDTFVFYDQEFCEENYPANAIITRMIATFYAGNPEFEKIIPMNDMFLRYHLTDDKLKHFRQMEWDFLKEIRMEKELESYHEKCRRKNEVVKANRERMNYAEEDYRHIFFDIFWNVEQHKLVLFGSGKYAKKFLETYGSEYSVCFAVDNSVEKWGKEVDGVKIEPPSVLQENKAEYKIMICIRNYLPVMKQLDEMGITEYSVYDPGSEYRIGRKEPAK